MTDKDPAAPAPSRWNAWQQSPWSNLAVVVTALVLCTVVSMASGDGWMAGLVNGAIFAALFLAITVAIEAIKRVLARR